MQPKTVTTLGELAIGDRFVYAIDKTKTVYQVAPLTGKPRMWKHKGKVFFADIEVWTDNGAKKYSKRSTQVVFLRHTDDRSN